MVEAVPTRRIRIKTDVYAHKVYKDGKIIGYVDTNFQIEFDYLYASEVISFEEDVGYLDIGLRYFI